MSSKIYVGGLPYATTDAQLQDLFSTHGAVESARVITDKFTGRSRGFRLRRDGQLGRSAEGDPGPQRHRLRRSQLDGQRSASPGKTSRRWRRWFRRSRRRAPRRRWWGRWRRWPQSLVVFSHYFHSTKRGARSERPFCFCTKMKRIRMHVGRKDSQSSQKGIRTRRGCPCGRPPVITTWISQANFVVRRGKDRPRTIAAADPRRPAGQSRRTIRQISPADFSASPGLTALPSASR